VADAVGGKLDDAAVIRSPWPSQSGSSCCSSGMRRPSSGTSCGGSARMRPTTSSRRRSCWPSGSAATTTPPARERAALAVRDRPHLLGRHRRDEIRLYKALARTGIDEVVAPFTDQVDERVTATAASRRLAEALAGLKAAYRDALLLVAWGGLSYEETATALGVPIGTVRSRISRARADLRRTLGDLAPASPDPTGTEETR
jgi:RNA polymerase sigma factor (sigma-70 family)